MANTYSLISSTTVGASPVATISFTNIPQEFDSLVIKLTNRNNDGSAWSQGQMTINADATTSNYSGKYLGYANGSIVAYTQPTTFGNYFQGYTEGTGTTGYFGAMEIVFPNYKLSRYKNYSVSSVIANNNTQVYFGTFAGIWSSTAAITSIELKNYSSLTWQQNTIATLYGIKKS